MNTKSAVRLVEPTTSPREELAAAIARHAATQAAGSKVSETTEVAQETVFRCKARVAQATEQLADLTASPKAKQQRCGSSCLTPNCQAVMAIRNGATGIATQPRSHGVQSRRSCAAIQLPRCQRHEHVLRAWLFPEPNAQSTFEFSA